MPLLVQFVGSFVTLTAFLATQVGWLSATSPRYLALNVIGSTALVISAIVEAQWGFVILEAAWLAVSALGLWRHGLGRRSPSR